MTVFALDNPFTLGVASGDPTPTGVVLWTRLLGRHQRRWLLDGLDRSQARWNVLAQQVLMAEVDLRPGPGRACTHRDAGVRTLARSLVEDGRPGAHRVH